MRKICLLLFVPLLALSGASCDGGMALAHIFYPVAAVGMPIQSAIEDSIENQRRWNSYPPPYREFITSRPRVGSRDSREESWEYYRQFVELLKEHSLTRQDQENGTARHLLHWIQYKSHPAFYYSESGGTFQDDAPFIEMILDDAEFFLDNPGPDDLNAMIASAILVGRYPVVLVLGDQRRRMAGLLVRVADKLITIDPEFDADSAVSTLSYALQMAPGENQRAGIRAKLNTYLRGCLLKEIFCNNYTLKLALSTFLQAASDEDEKIILFRQAADHYHFLNSYNYAYFKSSGSAPAIMNLLNAFSRPEDKMEVLKSLFESADKRDDRFILTRAILYNFLAATGDQRWGEMVPEFMAQNKELAPIVYEAELAMLKGDIAAGLRLHAQYLLDYVWDEYRGCLANNYSQRFEDANERRTFDCFRNRELPLSIPYVSAEGKWGEFSWNKPVPYYSGSQAAGWRRQSGSSPDQIVKEFYWNARGCAQMDSYVRARHASDRKPDSQARSCVNQVAQAMIKGQ
jgi:hypothetical protein